MAVTYNHKDGNKECQQAGPYEATLAGYEETTAKSSGKPMMVLAWKCFTPEGTEFIIKDRIVIPDGVWKIKRIAQAIGKEREFLADAFQPEDEQGCSLILDIGVQKSPGYDDQNNVKGYKPLERKKLGESPALAAQRKRAMSSKDDDKEPSFANAPNVDADIPF